MTIKTLPANEVIAAAESHAGIQAGIVGLKDVLQSPSHKANADDPEMTDGPDAEQMGRWPVWAQSVLVLGLYHPEEDLRLDYWERGNTWGNRRLREIMAWLRHWLSWTYHVSAYDLPYQAKRGGLFLKEAAALAGIGVIGRNNLLIHPKWGARIRLRAILLEGEFPATGVLEHFSPCRNCKVFCQKACPVNAFPRGKYNRLICREQMNTDLRNQRRYGEINEYGTQNFVIRTCRACEMACPVGA